MEHKDKCKMCGGAHMSHEHKMKGKEGEKHARKEALKKAMKK